MAKIQDYLSKILNSRYGKDVRQAIHDGIQQCYDDVASMFVPITQAEYDALVEAGTVDKSKYYMIVG